MRAALFALAWVAARADDCDWRAYGERHADVSAAFGADVESLRKHYVAHGKAEGRACPAKAVYHQTGRACEPDCAIDAHRLTEEASRPQAWESWGAPGGVDVKYLARPDMADGGGKAAFGDALVERVVASSGVVAPLGVRRCMEFCSGPAFIGFALLGRGACSHLVLAEANPLSVAAARETALANGLRGRVFPYLSDGLDGIPLNETGRLDLVFANPPRSPRGYVDRRQSFSPRCSGAQPRSTPRAKRTRWVPRRPHFASAKSWNAFFSKLVGSSEVSSDATLAMTVDAGWKLHARFYASVWKFLAPGGRLLFQENAGGSACADFLPMVRAPLALEGCSGADEHGYHARGRNPSSLVHGIIHVVAAPAAATPPPHASGTFTSPRERATGRGSPPLPRTTRRGAGGCVEPRARSRACSHGATPSRTTRARTRPTYVGSGNSS